MAICASSGKPVIIAAWLEDRLLVKQKQNVKNTMTQTPPPCLNLMKCCPR